MVYVAIVGMGDHAYGLAHLFSMHNVDDGSTLVVTKPNLQISSNEGTAREQYFHNTLARVVSWSQAVQTADIMILAIPAAALASFVMHHQAQLRQGTILVDPTNSAERGQDLQSVLSPNTTPWVKALNDVGATKALLSHPTSSKTTTTLVCSPFAKEREAVKQFIEASLGLQTKIVPFHYLIHVQQQQSQVGSAWVSSTRLMAIIFILAELYASVRYNIFKGYHWMHLPLQITNKAVCWTALNGFALTQVPGVFARLRLWKPKSWKNDIITITTTPVWLRTALTSRKELGLISLWFLVIHILMSVMLFNPQYYGKFFIDPSDGGSKLNAIGEASFLFAVLGAGFYAILGVSSLPQISMTHAQWSLVYGPVAWMALLCGTVHVLIMGVKGWFTIEQWPGTMPPITLTSTALPLLVLLAKAVQMLGVRCCSTSTTKRTRENGLQQHSSVHGNHSVLKNRPGTATTISSGDSKYNESSVAVISEDENSSYSEYRI